MANTEPETKKTTKEIEMINEEIDNVNLRKRTLYIFLSMIFSIVIIGIPFLIFNTLSAYSEVILKARLRTDLVRSKCKK